MTCFEDDFAACSTDLQLPVAHRRATRTNRASSWNSVGAPIGDRCKEMGVRSSIGSVGDAYDNAVTESFFARLECKFVAGHSWKTKTEARLALFTWIETTLCGAVSDCDNIKSIEKTVEKYHQFAPCGDR